MKSRTSFLFALSLLSGAAIADQQVYNLFDQPFKARSNGLSTFSTAQSVDNQQQKYNTNVRSAEEQSKVRLTVSGRPVEFEISTVSKEKETSWSFSGFNENKGEFIHFAESNGQVVGSVSAGGSLYKIRPTEFGTTTVTKVDPSELVDHEPGYVEEFDLRPMPVANHLGFERALAASDDGSEITVIVAYTSGFARDAGNINAYMQLITRETNESFANSGIATRVKIVHAYQTEYKQSGDFYNDRVYFSNGSNDETKKLRALRNEYAADVMMVLTGNSGYRSCGLARGIGVREDQAIAFAKESCAAGYYSFGHEIGHLVGARHIIQNDPSTTPFSYGHGYCNVTPNTWRTVMAYNCPSRTGGPRIQQWSNPNIKVNGERTGTSSVEYNAKVFNVRAYEVSNFRVSNRSSVAAPLQDATF